MSALKLHPSRSQNFLKLIFLLLPCVVFALCADRQHRLVDRYAVDVMYWDQWDLYGPLFRGDSVWASFDLQHGPHRQGVGGVMTRLIAGSTHWNTRGDAFAVSFTLIIATIVAGLLLWRCGAHLALPLVPLIVLSPRQFESLAVIPNPAHGALPILLLLLIAGTWFIQLRGARLMLLGLLTIAAIFTGFGFFAGLIVPLLLAIELLYAIDARDRRHAWQVAAALLTIAAGWGLFAHGYVFDPAVDGFKFPWDRPIQYLWFIGVMFANSLGVAGGGAASIAFGLIIAGLLSCLAYRSGVRIVKHGPLHQPRDTIVFSLASFVLLYTIDTAIGRVMLGIGGGAASRYVTLLIPGGLALLLELSDPATPRKQWLLMPLAVLLIARTTILRSDETAYLQNHHDRLLAWRAAYLQSRDTITADRQTGVVLYPTHTLADRMKYLSDHQLNLFAP